MGRRRQRAVDRPRGVRRNPWRRTSFGDHAGRHPGLAVRRRGVRDRRRACCRTRGRSSWSRRPVAGESTGCPTASSWTGSSSSRPTNATRCTSPTRPARPWFPIRATSRSSDHDQLATELVSKLLAGPRPEMAHTVRNLLAPPLRLRGPVTRADGGKNGIGRGYGGARIDLEKLSTTDPHSRQLLAAQIIWTLARADIRGPYVINADGAPLDDRFADGLDHLRCRRHRPGRGRRRGRGLARAGQRVTGRAGRAARHHRARRLRADGRPDRCRAVAQRAPGGVGGDAATRRTRTWRRRCGSAISVPRRSNPPTGTACRGPAGRWTTRSGWWSTPTMCCGRFRNRRRASPRASRWIRPRWPAASRGRSRTCSCPGMGRAPPW